MTKKQVGGLAAAAVIFILTGCVSVMAGNFFRNVFFQSLGQNVLNEQAQERPSEDYIAVINIKGVIEEQRQTSFLENGQAYKHDMTINFIDELMHDEYNQGILLYLDTPGGSVYESDELYLKLKAYKENTGNPVWSYMSHMAASGGYYVAMSSDKIYANRNAMTGSIGVIISGVDMTGLYDKLGIKYYSATSGDYKDSSIMTDEQLAILQSMVDEAYEQFVGIVSDGRNMSVSDVKKLADGRVYSAAQALSNGLIDGISSYESMQADMGDSLGTTTFYELNDTESIFSSIFSGISKIVPKSDTQILKEIKDEQKSGRLMYYAGQWR